MSFSESAPQIYLETVLTSEEKKFGSPVLTLWVSFMLVHLVLNQLKLKLENDVLLKNFVFTVKIAASRTNEAIVYGTFLTFFALFSETKLSFKKQKSEK